MKRPDRITAAFGAIVLTAVVVVGAFSASAAGGDETDPLVTLSYLTQVVTPELLKKVDEQVAANEQALTDKLNAAIDEYSKKLEQTPSQETGAGAVYAAVTLSAGQTLYPAAGSELLLRSGEAKVSAGADPILLDATAGSSLSVGGSLTANHLYVAPLDGAGIAASSACVFLVCGAYTIA